MRNMLITVGLSALLVGTKHAAYAQSAPVIQSDTRPAAPAADLVAAGIARAKVEQRLILVDFGSSWCGWCHAFDKFLADTAAGVGRTMHDNFVIVPLVVFEESPVMKGRDNPGSDTLLVHYRGTAPDGGIPFYAILDTTGRVLGTSHSMPDRSNIGHPDKPEEIDAFDRLLATVAPRITQSQRDEIRAYLVKMRPK